MASRLGVYWSVAHRRPQDYDFFRRLNPTVIKVMDGGDIDYKWIRENLPDALVVARIHALSEQHADMLKDPIGAGRRHAQEWNGHQARLGFDKAKTLILGVNEPKVWDAGVSEALRKYTIAMCDEATLLGLRVGAMQLSVGWPANNGPDTPPDWSPWHGVDNAIRHNNGALVLHEYWADKGPAENWGWWAGRALKCPWQVPIVIGECGIDMYVKDGSVPHAARGWRGRKEPQQYAYELAGYTGRMAQDPRFVGDAVFASDFANHEWFSFDIESAYQAILAVPIPDVKPDTPPVTVHLPSIGNGPSVPQEAKPATVPPLAHPIADPAQRIISQRFGENPQDYARFGLKGHNGVDFSVPEGTPVYAVDDGEIIEAEFDADGYGRYLKLKHAWGESIYAHLSLYLRGEGAQVKAGEAIALSGNTGNSSGPHLHFAMRVNPYTRGAPYDGYSDPAPYLAKDEPSPANRPEIVKAIVLAAKEFGVDSDLLLSQAWAESSFNPGAVSDAGAQGLMQIMPATWAEWSPKINAGDDPYDPKQNARVGAAYMKWLLGVTGGNVYRALAAYVWGIGNLQSAVKGGLSWPGVVSEYSEKIVHGADLLKAASA